jgi:hypothetical protein
MHYVVKSSPRWDDSLLQDKTPASQHCDHPATAKGMTLEASRTTRQSSIAKPAAIITSKLSLIPLIIATCWLFVFFGKHSDAQRPVGTFVTANELSVTYICLQGGESLGLHLWQRVGLWVRNNLQ